MSINYIEFLFFGMLMTSLFLLALFLFVFLRNRKSKTNLLFSLVCLSAFIWLFCYSQAYRADSQQLAGLWFKIGFAGVVFIAITYFHFTNTILNIHSNRKIIIFNYFMGVALICLALPSKLLVDEVHKFAWGFYPKAGILHPYFLVFFMILVNSASMQIAYTYILKKKELGSQLKLQQLKYILLAFAVFTLASIDFIPNYGINIFPVGFMPAAIFIFLIFYSIVKYRLLDMGIAITRTGIFIAVYSLVLGIPFALAFGWREQLQNLIGEMWWLAPLISSTVLATAGPFIFLYIQKKAEDQLLKEQRRYQTTLRRASLGMGRVKDLKRLLKLTVNIITRTVRIEHCEVYLTHRPTERYILKASQGWALPDNRVSFIPTDAPLVSYLRRHPEPLVYDEVKQRGQDFQDKVLEEIGKVMEELDAALLVPSFIEEDLIAILVLGRKRSGKLYSQDDLVVFAILANQAALAIENAQFYEEMKKTHDQLMKAEKMATIGTMADGLSHQINNRLHAMGFIASDALDTIKLQSKENLPPEAKKVYEEMEVSLGKIQENVKRGGEIVEGLLKYSRKTDEGFTAIELGKLFDAAMEMAQFKIKLNQIDIARNFNGAIPRIRGNFTQLQEVFFNMIDNSYDAMMQRKEEMKEHGYRGRLEISTQEDGKNLEIFLKDNGMGVQAKDFKRLFTPFFTTKLSSKKGTGLGLYVIRKIIEENHGGKVEFTSEYQKGSQTRLVLPIAT